MPESADYQVWVGGRKVPVWIADGNRPVASFAFDGVVDVRVRATDPFDSAAIHPTAFGVPVERVGEREIQFTLTDHGRSKVILRFDGRSARELFVFGDPPVDEIVDFSGNVFHFPAGAHYPTGGEIILSSDQALVLDPGAVVHARVEIAPNSRNVAIIGRGIINAQFKGRLDRPPPDRWLVHLRSLPSGSVPRRRSLILAKHSRRTAVCRADLRVSPGRKMGKLL
jgi:hypothetical protein